MTKEKIIEYSKEKFFSNGFHKITMDELAGELKISKKTIYKFFISKNKLVDAVVKSFQSYIKHRLENISTSDKNSILKIKDLSNIFSHLAIKINTKMIDDMRIYRPNLWEEIEKFRAEIIENFWLNILEQGKKEGYIHDYPNYIMINIIIASIQKIINPSFLLEQNLSINSAFELTFKILINGLLTEKGRKVYNNISKGNKK